MSKRSKEIKLVILGAAALGGCTDCNDQLNRQQAIECKANNTGSRFVYVPHSSGYAGGYYKKVNGFGKTGIRFSGGGGS